ncbi:hypothetical protein CPB86DRAFT_682410, partial [Serendipita vermifera]
LTTLGVHAQSSSRVPLASQSFEYTNLPYQVDPYPSERGPQHGYNICNSTTENQESLCQTAIINSLDDFCLWGPDEPNGIIGNVEGEAIAWCTKPGHGTRLIPAGALKGVQFIKTPDYVQVTGLIDQSLINIAPNDDGGEMDPHGADQLGNPIGGLVFSNAFSQSGGNANTYIQAIEWHNFMGANTFCLKACDPSRPNAARYCEHIFDRIGCKYNAPARYEEGVFESCLGESQDFPGVYVSGGQTITYQQPPESLGPITSIPYEPRTPATSSCTAGVSSVLYSAAPSPSGATTTSATRSSTTNTRSTGSATRSTSTTNTSSGAAGAGVLGASPMASGWIAGVAAL